MRTRLSFLFMVVSLSFICVALHCLSEGALAQSCSSAKQKRLRTCVDRALPRCIPKGTSCSTMQAGLTVDDAVESAQETCCAQPQSKRKACYSRIIKYYKNAPSIFYQNVKSGISGISSCPRRTAAASAARSCSNANVDLMQTCAGDAIVRCAKASSGCSAYKAVLNVTDVKQLAAEKCCSEPDLWQCLNNFYLVSYKNMPKTFASAVLATLRSLAATGCPVVPTQPPVATATPTATPTHGPTCTTTERTVTITNNSSVDMWLGVTAGTLSCLTDADCPTAASGSCKGANAAAGVAGTCQCSTQVDCGTVAQCNANNSLCYWNLPVVASGQYHMPVSAQTVLCFPPPQSGKNIQWSGNIFGRTGCDANGQNCQTGDCLSITGGACATATGGVPPATLIEFTLSNQVLSPSSLGPDYYDISIINGINLAASFSPVAGTYQATNNDPYSCTSPGATTQPGTLTGCSWTVTPSVSSVDQTNLLRDVNPVSFANSGLCPNGGTPNSLGYCECSVDSDCSSSGLVCGLALNAKVNQQYTQVCGNKIGWWTANQICSSSVNNQSPLVPFGYPLYCADAVTNSDLSTSTRTNLHNCSKPAGATNPEQSQSCYSNGAAFDCCGCATSLHADFGDWPTIVSSSFGGQDNGCYNNNSNWVTIAQPWLVFLKKACPTAYTYPYDDATSTFTCQGASGVVGPPSYQASFFDTL